MGNTGELIGSGRDADVFALDQDWVLRRYRNGRDARPEARTMTYLRALGYPVPEVRPTDGADPAELVMRRLSGATMLEAVLGGSLSVAEAARTLADLLVRLHAIPAEDGAEAQVDNQ